MNIYVFIFSCNQINYAYTTPLLSRYARNADNYEMVMTAARHYWNACVPLVSQPIERELLREPIKVILQCITATAEKIKKKEVLSCFDTVYIVLCSVCLEITYRGLYWKCAHFGMIW